MGLLKPNGKCEVGLGIRNFLTDGSRWVWLLVLLLVSLLALGLVFLPEVLKGDYAAPRTPAGLYIMSLLTLALIIGMLISLAVERFERPMVILFIAFRIGENAWEYELGRHSEWYLAVSVILHLLIGGAVLLFLSGHIERRDNKRQPDTDDQNLFQQ
jgi:hypothetical protein